MPDLEAFRCAVSIFKKERWLVHQLRASNNLSEDFIDKNEETIFDNDILIIEGYFLQEKFDICKKLVERFILLKNNV